MLSGPPSCIRNGTQCNLWLVLCRNQVTFTYQMAFLSLSGGPGEDFAAGISSPSLGDRTLEKKPPTTGQKATSLVDQPQNPTALPPLKTPLSLL